MFPRFKNKKENRAPGLTNLSFVGNSTINPAMFGFIDTMRAQVRAARARWRGCWLSEDQHARPGELAGPFWDAPGERIWADAAVS